MSEVWKTWSITSCPYLKKLPVKWEQSRVWSILRRSSRLKACETSTEDALTTCMPTGMEWTSLYTRVWKLKTAFPTRLHSQTPPWPLIKPGYGRHSNHTYLSPSWLSRHNHLRAYMKLKITPHFCCLCYLCKEPGSWEHLVFCDSCSQAPLTPPSLPSVTYFTPMHLIT